MTQTPTPNPNTIYLMPFIDTTSVGPMVMEIPPAEGGAIVGSLMDVWQVPIEDVGIAGVDKGQVYFFSIFDDKGNYLEGGGTYRLRVPANAPVRQYWSVVAYDRETHALIRDMPRSNRASNVPEVKQNPDGSVDIWFGTESPKGKESNWIPTKKNGRFELVFRAYGPEPPLFNKTWVPPNLEKTK